MGHGWSLMKSGKRLGGGNASLVYSSLRDERLPEGTRFASEFLNAGTYYWVSFSNWPNTKAAYY